MAARFPQTYVSHDHQSPSSQPVAAWWYIGAMQDEGQQKETHYWRLSSRVMLNKTNAIMAPSGANWEASTLAHLLKQTHCAHIHGDKTTWKKKNKKKDSHSPSHVPFMWDLMRYILHRLSSICSICKWLKWLRRPKAICERSSKVLSTRESYYSAVSGPCGSRPHCRHWINDRFHLARCDSRMKPLSPVSYCIQT